jgi:serine/threonine-protein kinase
LAFSVALSNLQVYDWQRDVMTRLTLAPGEASNSPVWMPDGSHIAFGTFHGDGSSSLGWIRSDGAREAQRLLESKNLLRPYSFSPDGKRLAYAEDNPETSSDLWMLPLNLSDPEHPKPGKPEPFLVTPARESEPAFSPDGRWIAYVSHESGSSEIQVRPFPGPGGKWRVSTMAAVHPVWSRNGRELFFENPTDKRIWVATYTAKGDMFMPDKPRVWSEGQIVEPNIQYWNIDLSPDGKRFAVLPRPDATDEHQGSVHVTVLLNFFDELRRRLPLSGK